MQTEAAHQDALIIRRVKPGITKVSAILYPASRAPECILHGLSTVSFPSARARDRVRPSSSPFDPPVHTDHRHSVSPLGNGRAEDCCRFFFSFFPFFLFFRSFVCFRPGTPRYISGSISHATKDVLVSTRSRREGDLLRWAPTMAQARGCPAALSSDARRVIVITPAGYLR